MAQIATVNSVISQVIQETPDTVTLALDLEQPLPHIPGQSIGIDPKQFEGLQDRIRLVREIARQKNVRALTAVKLYSLADSTPDFARLWVTIKEEPDAEGYPPALLSPFAVRLMKEGHPVVVTGPYGKKFLFQPRPGDRFILWGAGSGVVPLMYFIEYTHRNKLDNPIRFFDSNKTPEDIIYRTRLDEIARENPRIRIIHSITRPHLSQTRWEGRAGRLAEQSHPEDARATRLAADIAILSDGIPLGEAHHYICGPLSFGKSIRQALRNDGVSDELISVEAYG